MPDPVKALADELADAIATGAAVDWDRFGHRLRRLGSPPLLQNLRFLASRLRVDARSGVEIAAPPAWERFVAWAAAIQVAGALLGATVGVPLAHVLRILPYVAIAAFGGAGAWLCIAGRDDARARRLGVFFLLMATAPGQVPLRALLASLPLGGLEPWLAHLHLDAFLPLFLWLFVKDFPGALKWGRDAALVRAGIGLSALCGALLFLANYGLGVAGRGWAPVGLELGALGRGHPGGAYWTTVLVLTLLALPVPVLRARRAPPAEAARVRFFVWALVAALLPLIADNLASFLSPAWDEFSGRPETGVVTAPVVYAFLLSLPLTTSWAVLRHGTVQVRDLMRSALRVVFARWTLGLVTGGVIAASAVLVYRHRDANLRSLASSPEGMALALLAGIGVLLLASRETVLFWVERVLTGRERSWRRGAARPLARARYARSFGELSECLGEGVGIVVPGGGAELLVREAGAAAFRHLGSGHDALSAETALVAMLRATPSPLRVQAEVAPSWFRWLPERERQWVVASRAALLAPILGRSGDPIAVVVVREPEVPPAIDDESVEYLEELASAAAAALEGLLQGAAGSVARVLHEEPGFECPSCLALFEADDRPCACPPAPVRSLLPMTLGGKFELERLLGQGAMGRVYLAEELALGRRVALKAMPRRSASASVALRREARAMAAVSHPNLASIHGMETWRDVPVLVVEYLPGGTLAQRLEAPWDAVSVLELGAGLASGLTALHATGLAHRDIKPSNIAFAADGTPKLLDFGLTRRASAPSSGSSASGSTPAPAASSAAGTPLYLSPELLRGEDTPLAEQDLWALSVLLCEVLAGRHPLYLGDGDPLERLSRGEVLPPEPRSSGQDEDVSALLARCLSPDRGQRPASAAVLLDDLKGLLAPRAG